MKQQTVYIPISIVESTCKVVFNQNIIDNVVQVENAIVFTAEELLALKKQVASHAFEAGKSFGNCIDSFFETVFENKEQYLEGINNYKHINTITNE